jgi:hypothetical protein
MNETVKTTDVLELLSWLRVAFGTCELPNQCNSDFDNPTCAQYALDAAMEEVKALATHPYRLVHPDTGYDPPHPFKERAETAESDKG